MDLVAIDSGQTFGVDSRIESLFPCEDLSGVAQKGAKDSQRIFFVLFSPARLECDLDCWDSWGDWKVVVRCYSGRWTRLWLRGDIDLFPVEFVVVAVELSLSVMFTVVALSGPSTAPPVGLLRFTVNDSGPSAKPSSFTRIVMVWVVSPGLKVKRPAAYS